jgi:hypothetical protein
MTPATPINLSAPDRQLANAIRILSVDAVQAANSGHPGAPWAWPTSLKCCGAHAGAT